MNKNKFKDDNSNNSIYNADASGENQDSEESKNDSQKKSKYDLPSTKSDESESLMDTKGKVDYNVTKMDECDHPKCESRRKYGVSVKKEKKEFLFGVSIISHTSNKIFCPKHRSSTVEAQEAIEKEHEEAREKWNEVKINRNRKRFNKIIESDIIPRFKYLENKNKMISKFNENRLEISVNNYDDGIEYIIDLDIDIPCLVYNDQKFSIINKYDTVEEYSKDDVIISYDNFKERFNDIKYLSRDFNTIRTNLLTGKECSNISVKEIDDLVDKVVEWKEYTNTQGRLNINYCPACGSRCLNYHRNTFSRVIIDGEEKIIPIHSECNQIMGELNEQFIDKEKYEIYNN